MSIYKNIKPIDLVGYDGNLLFPGIWADRAGWNGAGLILVNDLYPGVISDTDGTFIEVSYKNYLYTIRVRDSKII